MRVRLLLTLVCIASLSFASDRKQLKDAVAAVDANLKTREGKKYEEHTGKDFEKYIPAVRDCKKTESGTPADFDMFLRLNADGKIADVLIYPETPMAKCSQGVLRSGQFSPPPHADYWVNIHMTFKR
jgi:hypothetical protein